MTFLNYILLMAPQEGGKEGSMTSTLIMMGMIVVVFYFFMIRPQMKQRKEMQKFREELKKGDKIVTMGGIHGKVAEIKEDKSYVIIEVEGGGKLRVEKAALTQEGSPIMGQK